MKVGYPLGISLSMCFLLNSCGGGGGGGNPPPPSLATSFPASIGTGVYLRRLVAFGKECRSQCVAAPHRFPPFRFDGFPCPCNTKSTAAARSLMSGKSSNSRRKALTTRCRLLNVSGVPASRRHWSS